WDGLHELIRDLPEVITSVFQPGVEKEDPRQSLAWYFAALSRRDGFIAHWQDFFEKVDALLLPSAATPAFRHCTPGASIPADAEHGGRGDARLRVKPPPADGDQPSRSAVAGCSGGARRRGPADRAPDRGPALVRDAAPGDCPGAARSGGPSRFPAAGRGLKRVPRTPSAQSPSPSPSRSHLAVPT